MSTRVRWLGHACVLVESDGKSILMDPFLTGNPKAAVKASEVSADFILISHGHSDHIGDAIDIAKRTGATVVANYEISEWLKGQGLEKVHGMQHGGGFGFDFGRLKLTLAFHGSVLPDGTYGGNPGAAPLPQGRRQDLQRRRHRALWRHAAHRRGGNRPRHPAHRRQLHHGPDDALRAVKLLQPRKVLPVHYNTWDVIAQDGAAWGQRVKNETPALPVILKPGDGEVREPCQGSSHSQF